MTDSTTPIGRRAALSAYISSLPGAFGSIPPERRRALDEIVDFVLERVEDGVPVELTFICTHNARRSQFGQVWAKIAADHYGVPRVETHSGGTETTALSRRAIAALERTGLGIRVRETDGDNPRVEVDYADARAPLECFSKTIDHPTNPDANFAALMTCTSADEACPFVPGAARRIAIAYDDPKLADGTARETEVYDARCRQIAVEMFYVMSRAATAIG